MKRILGCAMLVAMAAVAGAGQVIKVPESWQKLAAKADQVTSINMDRNMLKFASKFMDNEGDEEGKRLVSKAAPPALATIERAPKPLTAIELTTVTELPARASAEAETDAA